MEDDYDYCEGPPPANSQRRSFLSAALATVTVAAVSGGAAALLLEDDGPPVITTGRPPTIAPPATSAAPDADLGYLQTRLSALEAENNDLRISLSAARRQLASYTGAAADNGSAEDWRRQVEQANVQAGELAGRLAAVQGLLGLYEELEAIDVGATATDGLAVVGGELGDLMAELPLLAEGLAAGRRALDEFEEQVSLVEQGRQWLERQIAVVDAALQAAEAALSSVLEASGSFLQLVNRWFEDILKWLPFGIGKGALAIMTAVGDLLARVPETLSGLRANVADPLDLWLARDGEDNRLQRHLIKPLRGQAFDRADSTVAGLGAVDQAFQVGLREPLSTLVERQRVVREQIAHYRQNHAL